MKSCGIYHENFRKCEIDLIVYNLYGLWQALLAYKDLFPAEPPQDLHPDLLRDRGQEVLDNVFAEADETPPEEGVNRKIGDRSFGRP